MSKLYRTLLGAVVSFCVGGAAAMGQVAPQPAGKAAVGGEVGMPNTVIVAATKGKTDCRLRRNADFTVVSAGMTLTEAAEIRTAPIGENWVQIKIGETQLFTITRGSYISVKQAIKKSGEAVTTVSMEYGFMKVEVDSTRLANNVRIETPDATLAVSGTGLFVYHIPGRPTRTGGLVGNTGLINVFTASGGMATLSGDQQSDAKTPSPAERLSDRRIVDTADTRSRETDEKALIKRSVGGGDAAAVSLGVEPSTIAGGSSLPQKDQVVKKNAQGTVTAISGQR